MRGSQWCRANRSRNIYEADALHLGMRSYYVRRLSGNSPIESLPLCLSVENVLHVFKGGYIFHRGKSGYPYRGLMRRNENIPAPEPVSINFHFYGRGSDFAHAPLSA